MNWNGWQDFFAMGGYGGYVWGATGVALLAMLAEAWLVERRLRLARAAAGATEAAS